MKLFKVDNHLKHRNSRQLKEVDFMKEAGPSNKVIMSRKRKIFLFLKLHYSFVIACFCIQYWNPNWGSPPLSLHDHLASTPKVTHSLSQIAGKTKKQNEESHFLYWLTLSSVANYRSPSAVAGEITCMIHLLKEMGRWVTSPPQESSGIQKIFLEEGMQMMLSNILQPLKSIIWYLDMALNNNR